MKSLWKLMGMLAVLCVLAAGCAAQQKATAPVQIVVAPPPLAITTTSLPGAVVNAAYNATLAAQGGMTPYSWIVASGSLPPGLTLSTAGVISGTPTAAGTFNFTVQCTDSSAPANTTTVSVSVATPDKAGGRR